MITLSTVIVLLAASRPRFTTMRASGHMMAKRRPDLVQCVPGPPPPELFLLANIFLWKPSFDSFVDDSSHGAEPSYY